eukprot:gene16607-5088_t
MKFYLLLSLLGLAVCTCGSYHGSVCTHHIDTTMDIHEAVRSIGAQSRSEDSDLTVYHSVLLSENGKTGSYAHD